MSLYDILGVSKTADSSEIKIAYRNLALQHHPDKGGDSEKFKEINSAYEVLSDEGKRRHYDMTGSDTQDEHPFARGHPFGMPDLFGQMFGGMFQGPMGNMGPMGPMGHMGHMGQGNRKREGKGPGKTQDIPLRISDYYHGRLLNIKLGRQSFCKGCKGSGASSMKPCEPCNGLGKIRQMVMMGPIQMINEGLCAQCSGKGQQMIGQCSECSGRGFIPEEKVLEIRIEPGMQSGNTIIFQGMCSDHPNHSEAGDVTVVLREADEEGDSHVWKREGVRLTTSIVISLAEALLGTVKVIKGHPGFSTGVPIEIPAGVQNMWTCTVSGLGMPIRGTPKFGDANVTVAVMPTQEEHTILRQQSVLLKSMFPIYTQIESSDTKKAVFKA
jgi:DnaJ family protein A protein 2